MYKFYNPNPKNKFVDDCTVRAIAKILDLDWDTAYLELCTHGFEVKNMPSVNRVWGGYLRELGFRRYTIPNSCPDCYTVRDFCRDHPRGNFVLGTGSHVIAVINGDYYDTGDSGGEVPIYYFTRSD